MIVTGEINEKDLGDKKVQEKIKEIFKENLTKKVLNNFVNQEE